VNDTAATPDTPAADTAAAPAPAAPAAARTPGHTPFWIGTAVLGALALVAITLALIGQQRIKALEQELVRRQQDSQGQAIEARALAQQAQDLARAAEGKVALLEGRVAETALQRTQLEELIQQLSRSRDENVLADVDAAVRVAVQQSGITGSAEPLAAALRQSEERLARMNQPRLERVRRALARDLERVRAVAVSDVASLTIKLDEAIRSVDDMPLLAQPDPRPAAAPRPGSAAAPRAATPASAASIPATLPGMAWWTWLQAQGAWAGEQVWSEVRGLVRVTRIANPEAVLVAPDQAWFLRENLKLRLLNARLALLSRQYDTAQADLRDAVATLERYFDRSVRRVVLSTDLLRQVAGQARQLNLPRPDETLAALSAAQAGR
jgi:uroporphyrin-3 C-methyltransferase